MGTFERNVGRLSESKEVPYYKCSESNSASLKSKVDPATVVSMMHLLTMLRIRLPLFASVYSAAAMDMPRNMFEVLISQYWPKTEMLTSIAKHGATVVQDVEPDEKLTLSWAHQAELGHAICSLMSGFTSVDGEAAPW